MANTIRNVDDFRDVENGIKRTQRREKIEALVLIAMGFILVAVLYYQFM